VHKKAPGIAHPAANPACELVELAEAEPARSRDNHHGCPGYVYSHLDHRGTDQYPGLSGGERGYRLDLLPRGHAPVKQHRSPPAQGSPADPVEGGLRVQRGYVVGNLLQGVHHEGLLPQGQSFQNEFRQLPLPVVGYDPGNGSAPARRHHVYDRQVQVPVQGHGQGPGNRGGAHYQNVGSRRPSRGEFFPLQDSELVLLVHHQQGKPAQGNPVLQHRVGTHQHTVRPTLHIPGQGLSGGSAGTPGEQTDLDSETPQETPQAPMMLHSQHLVGARSTAVRPDITHLAQAAAATTVLPDPTSPCSSLLMGSDRERSPRVSPMTLSWAPVRAREAGRRTPLENRARRSAQPRVPFPSWP
jgi:hypothetical protein